MRKLKSFLTAGISSSLSLPTRRPAPVCDTSMCLKCLRVKLAQGLSLTSLKLRLTVPGVFLQAFFLVDDDVLNVLHGQVIAESVEEDVFQLL